VHKRLRTYLAVLAVLALALTACNGDGDDTAADDEGTGEAGGGGVILAEEVETDELYGIGIQQDNAALKDAIDAQLAAIIADGTYEDIYSTWFEGEVPERFQSGDGEAAEGDAADPGDLGLIDEGVLRVGSDIDFAPFEFIEAGEPQGFDIDLMTEIAERLDLEVEFINTGFDGIFSQLAIGEFDAIISAITITEERRETIEFSEPYFAANQGLATLEGSDVGGVADLTDGVRVAVQAATTGAEYASANFTDAEIVEFPTSPAAFAALDSGQVDAVFIDLPVIGARIAGTLEDETETPVGDDEAVDEEALEESDDEAADS
jgi:ABC-type amino acid transport substrate-binding protein